MLERCKSIFQGRSLSGGSAGIIKLVSFVFVAIFFMSCAPVTLYTIDLRYSQASTSVPRVTEKGDKFRVTVARFNDMRNVEDKLVIGSVVKPDGKKIPVLPKYTKPVDAILKGMQAYLEDSGYNVSSETPQWDLKKESIDKEWGDVLIGGSIDDLEVVCLKGSLVKKYNTKVKFTVYFADVKGGKIFYKITVETKPSLEHVRFSEEMLAKQINGGLTEAIEKVFEGREIYQKIQSALE
ncbi:MAG: hypothetical protein HQ589_03890 [Syntrophaceae bacterium]|nr:hypothetical protein [Syntrophaceae bacterium]